ncbi:hypothetical protein [Magnetospirillum fulvum]|nr:hypothetical protein [Magnetospirillum fulvum]
MSSLNQGIVVLVLLSMALFVLETEPALVEEARQDSLDSPIRPDKPAQDP